MQTKNIPTHKQHKKVQKPRENINQPNDATNVQISKMEFFEEAPTTFHTQQPPNGFSRLYGILTRGVRQFFDKILSKIERVLAFEAQPMDGLFAIITIFVLNFTTF